MIVRDVLSFGGLYDATVLAGEAGLEQTLESVTTVEVTDRELANWITENQLYISALYSISEDIAKQHQLIHLLKEHGACGLVLCHVGHWLKRVDDSLIRLCDELGFPLIMANPETSYMDILYPILNATMGEHNRDGNLISGIQGELLSLLEGGDIKKTFAHLAELQKVRVTYLDPYCNCVFSNIEDAVVEQQRKDLLDNFADFFMRLRRDKHIISDHRKEHISLICAKNTTFGFLILTPLDKYRIEDLEETAEMLGMLFSLVYGRSALTLHLCDYYKDEFITDLLVWNFMNVEQAVKRGLDVGMDIRDKNILCVVNLNNYHKTDAAEWELEQETLKKEILPFVEEQCKWLDPNGIIHFPRDQILLILNSRDQYEEVLSRMQNIADHVRNSGISVSCGISALFTNVSRIPEAYQQANAAYSLGREYLGTGKVVAFRDVSLFAWVLEEKNTEEIRDFATQALEPIRRYDEEHGMELMKTLEVMLRCGGNIAKASKELYMHRNTVTNHCVKIQEILGFSPFIPPYSVNYLLAVQLIK